MTALVLTVLGYWTAAEVVLGLLASAALLESALGLCLGCKAFAVSMRVGVVPEEVCERCNNIWAQGGGAAGLNAALSCRRPGRPGCSCRRACPGSPG